MPMTPLLEKLRLAKKSRLKVQQKLFQGMSVDELYEQAAAHCAEGTAEYKGKR